MNTIPVVFCSCIVHRFPNNVAWPGSSLILVDAVGALPAILDTTTGHMAPIDIPEYPHPDPRNGDTEGTAAADYCFASCFHPGGERVFVGAYFDPWIGA
jgi:hypothetical protein